GSGNNEKSATGYVGLQNQGATCYMNSLVQQLYLIPPFRKGILSVPYKDDDKEENLLFQFQVMFAYLQESAKKYYDTAPFCHTCKDYDGRPVNTAQQMDANEFFNMLFDKLETHLKDTNQRRLLPHLFAGKLSNQLICQECSHKSERD